MGTGARPGPWVSHKYHTDSKSFGNSNPKWIFVHFEHLSNFKYLSYGSCMLWASMDLSDWNIKGSRSRVAREIKRPHSQSSIRVFHDKQLAASFNLAECICLTSLTRAKWNFLLNFPTMRKLSDLYSGIFQNSLTCAKWNFPLNFRTMRKLSDLYSGIFQNYWLFNHLAFNMHYSF